MHRADSSEWRKGGSLTFAGGANGSVPPSHIATDQYAFGVNCQCRGGSLRPRPGFVKQRTDFADADDITLFKDTRFQHASFYTHPTHPALISVHGGRLFRYDLHTGVITNITPGALNADVNSSLLEMGWSVQMEQYWAYQDNSSLPIIFDGASSRRSNQSQKEIPVGNVMGYVAGRLLVALPNRSSFRIGNLLLGDGTVENVLRFSENDYLNTGGDFVARVFGAPSNLGPITSIKAAAMPDTSLGQGPAQIGTPFCFFTVRLPFDRAEWKNLANPMQTVVPINGTLAQDSTILVNTDLWYRGIDGIRSYIMARREMESLGNTPMSAEIAETLEYDTESLLEFGSGVLFKNRIHMTVSPVRTEHGVYHRGITSLDLTGVSTLRGKSGAAWDGIWTGLRILKILTGIVDKQERCFMYVLGCDDQIEIWELDPKAKFDEGDTPITWSIDFPSYNCGNADNFKRLETGRIILNGLVGDLTGTIKYRSDQNPCWMPWDTFSVCAKKEDCEEYDDCTGPQTYREQSREPIKLKMPPDTFNENGEKRLMRTGYEFQPRAELTGWGEIRQFRVFAKDTPEMLAPNERDFS